MLCQSQAVLAMRRTHGVGSLMAKKAAGPACSRQFDKEKKVNDWLDFFF